METYKDETERLRELHEDYAWQVNAAVGEGRDDLAYGMPGYAGYDSYTTLPTTPATVELVAFRPPEDVGTLLSYTYLNRPPEEQVLAACAGLEPGQPVEFAVSDTVLIGLRMRTTPTDPGPLPPLPMPAGRPGRGYWHNCGANLHLEFQPATP